MFDPSIIIFSLFSSALLSLIPRIPSAVKDFICILSTFSSLIIVLANLYNPYSGVVFLNAFLDFSIKVNGFTLFLALIVSFTGFMVAIYSVSYIEDKTIYNSLVLTVIGCLIVMSFSWNLLILFIFSEVCVFSSSFLIVYHKNSISYEAALKYLIIQFVSSILILSGIYLLYVEILKKGFYGISIFNFDFLAEHLDVVFSAKMGVILILIGFMAKFPLFPMHIWLPDASTVCPASISVLLHTMMIKIASIPCFLTLFKLSHVFSNSMILWILLCWLGIVTMLVNTIMAIAQNDVKRLLAFDSVGQMGYVVLGLGIGGLGFMKFNQSGDVFWFNVAFVGLTSGLLHMFNHTLFKSILFFCFGNVEHETGIRDINMLGGLFKHMPYTSISIFIGSLAISGIPFLNGFVSKWMIYNACIGGGEYFMAFISIFTSALTFLLFMRLVGSTLLGLSRFNGEFGEASKLMVFSSMFPSVFCIIFGVAPQIILRFLLYPAVFSLIPMVSIPVIDPFKSLIEILGGFFDVYWLFSLFMLMFLMIYLIIHRFYLRGFSMTYDDKYLPFTGGVSREPYIAVSEIKVSSTPFTWSMLKLINLFRSYHMGFINWYMFIISTFIIITISLVFLGVV